MPILFFKADQLGLFEKLVPVKASVGKDGTVRAAHTAIRHVKHQAPAKPQHPATQDLFDLKPAPEVKREPEVLSFETFATKHGASRADIGDAGLHTRGHASEATHQRKVAKQVEKDMDLVARRDALRTEFEAKVAAGEIREPTNAELLGHTANGHPDRTDTQAAKRVMEKRAARAAADQPKEGDRKTEDGVEYELQGGRWHKVAADEDAQAFDAAQDREDIARSMINDPHSEDSKRLLAEHVAKNAPAPLDDLDPSSPNYRFRDTGYVAGSRKEKAAEMLRRAGRTGERVRVTDVDWDALEENPREAKDLIVKDNLFGTVNWEDWRDSGMEPGAGFLVSKIYAAVATAPATDTGAGRYDYSLAITSLRDRLEKCRTPAEVLAEIEVIHSERDGVLLNPEEAKAYAAAEEVYHAEALKVRAIKAGDEEISKRWSAAQSAASAAGYEITKRERRKWKVDPADLANRDRLIAEAEKLKDESLAYRKDNGMEPIRHQEKTPNGVQLRLEYPYRAEVERAGAAMRAIRTAATFRNRTENPLTRAWNSLGERFQGVIDYRTHKGSDVFGKHVATVKADTIRDWSWAEKKTDPRGASKRSTSFQLHVADRIERKGGRAVEVGSTEALKSTFGLRDVQSGNWVLDDPNAAKFHVEHCAGGFADLADVLGVSDKEIAFNGRLAMAFGARGQGGKTGKAHYEPIQRVINMTKMAGAGSLAHEHWHMVDNLVKEATGGGPAEADDFGTINPYGIGDPELGAAFRRLSLAMTTGDRRASETVTWTEAEEKWADHNMAGYMSGSGVRAQIKDAASVQAAVDRVDAMFQRGAFGPVDKKKAQKARDSWRKIAIIAKGKNAERSVTFATGPGLSQFMIDALELDKGAAGKYWSAPHEMAARAFSAYVEDRLAAQGRKNTYLVSDANNAAYAHTPYRPFPEEAERERIHTAFDQIWELMRKGDVLAKAALLLEFERLEDPPAEVVTASSEDAPLPESPPAAE